MVSIPRIVLAAPSSSAGKTSIATGLIAALTDRGMAVSPHKVGPDYIDPGYHGLAAGRPGRNLDNWLVGEERIVPLFLHGSRGADVAVVEGVMGLFDGASHPSVEPGFGFSVTASAHFRARRMRPPWTNGPTAPGTPSGRPCGSSSGSRSGRRRTRLPFSRA